MASPVYNPMVPYLGMIPGGMTPGKMVRVNGTMHPQGQRFAVNIQCGPGVNPRDDMALHANFRVQEQCVVRNHLQSGGWGGEELDGGLPIQPGQPFQLLILCEPHAFKLAVNGSHFCEFIHRLPYQRATYITIDGDVSVSMITFEGGDNNMGYQQGPPSYNSAMAQPPMNPMMNQGMGGGMGMGMPVPGQMGPMVPPPYSQAPPYQHNYVPQQAGLSYAPAPAGFQPSAQIPMYGNDPMGGPTAAAMMPPVQYKKEESSMGMKALKYGLPLAGVGLGAYALGGGFSHSSHSSDDEDSDWLG